MTSREKLLRKPLYWFDHEQNEIFRQVTDYMEREGINRAELARRLNVSRGYVTQILNGNFNYTLKRWIELCLTIGIVPAGYKKVEDVIHEDAQRKIQWANLAVGEENSLVSDNPQKQVENAVNSFLTTEKLSSSYLRTDDKSLQYIPSTQTCVIRSINQLKIIEQAV